MVDLNGLTNEGRVAIRTPGADTYPTPSTQPACMFIAAAIVRKEYRPKGRTKTRR